MGPNIDVKSRDRKNKFHIYRTEIYIYIYIFSITIELLSSPSLLIFFISSISMRGISIVVFYYFDDTPAKLITLCLVMYNQHNGLLISDPEYKEGTSPIWNYSG